LAFLPILPVKLAPSQTLPQINVRFNMPGSASRVVEMEVSSKLEAMFSRIKGVENITSTSGNGWGNINIRFDKYVNVDAARFEVSAVIRQIWPHLPAETNYPVISLSRSDENADRPFLSYTVNAPANPVVIRRFAENIIQQRLSQIEGVNRIDVQGAMPMEWRLEYDYKQLETLNLSVSDIQDAIAGHLNREFFGMAYGDSQSGDRQWIRISLSPNEDAESNFNPADIYVKNVDGRLISLDKIVSVERLEQNAHSYYRINGLNSIYLSITAEENANQLKLSREIKETLNEMKRLSLFPAGYEMHLSYDATEYIDEELDKVYFRSGLTMVILLLFVLIIYRNAKYLLLISASLFMNIAIALIFYYFGGLEIQLYSLAGITISLTLVIDNTIVMSDQLIRRGNKKAFSAILAATITTIASLIIIFFMDEKIRLNLQDFALVIIINLATSLFIALFLVPALIEKLKIGAKRKFRRRRRFFLDRIYVAFCRFMWRFRVAACILLLLVFGLPVFMIPDKLEGEGRWHDVFNKTLGSQYYKGKIKPHVDTWMGGTLRLFAQKVFEGSYFSDRSQTSVYVTATLPNGATVTHMNNLIQRMETYISQFTEVRQFQTNIQSARRASIYITFTKEGERTGFPYVLKSKLISKSIELGGGSWTVSGLGDGFSNEIREFAGSYQVLLYGYNYDELSEWTERFKQRLLENRRIKEVIIASEFSYFKDDYQEFVFKLNRERLAQENIRPIELFASLKPTFGQDISAGMLAGEFGMERIVLHSRQSKEYDIWSLENIPGKTGVNTEYKLAELAGLEKMQAPQNIVKENQQYRLCLQFEYIGAGAQGRKLLERNIKEFKTLLPMGYTIESRERYWAFGKDGGKQYALLLLIFVIIYFMCSILFNSLRQPFSVIFVIPVSFIGIFLTFYLFKLNFDQGGFASFILLCGLSVNANIYIINEYNSILHKRKISRLRAYIMAWNAKIRPIFLTIVSTVLGFIPFMIGETKEAFWFPLAAGTIGGLIVSFFGIFCFLPLFMGVAKWRKD
jgi:multidrug efflux pump subunit AcrB